MQTKKSNRLFAFRRGHTNDHATPATLPGQYAYELPDYVPRHTEQLVVRVRRVRTAYKLFGAVAGIAAIVMSTFAWQVYAQANRVFQGENSVVSAQSISSVPQILQGEAEGRINILVLGAAGEGKPGGDLTDTMLIFSIDPVNHKTTLINVPKDLWVAMPTPYYGAKQKINVAFAAGKYQKLGRAGIRDMSREAMQAGFVAADQIVATVTGIKIDYHVYIQSTSFEKAIDAVGGIELDIQRRLYDPMLAYDNGKNSLILSPGKQTVSGKKALLYARSEAAGGMRRIDRQQQILLAFQQKALSLGTLGNPAKLQELLASLGDSMYSDLSFRDAYRLFGMLRPAADTTAFTMIDLASPDYTTVDKSGQDAVLRPKAGFDSYTAIQNTISSQLPDGVLIKENTQLAVVAPTRTRALEASQSLRRQGYSVTETILPSLTSRGGSVALVDLSNGTAAYARAAMVEKYNVPIMTHLPEGVVVPSGTEFAIILY